MAPEMQRDKGLAATQMAKAAAAGYQAVVFIRKRCRHIREARLGPNRNGGQGDSQDGALMP